LHTFGTFFEIIEKVLKGYKQPLPNVTSLITSYVQKPCMWVLSQSCGYKATFAA